MKIKKTKKKQKGVRYIAKVLQKYGGKKYKNYSQALEKARSVLPQIKEKGEKVKVTTILDKSRKHRGKIKPELYYKLQSPEPYWSLIEYPGWINNTTSEIIFVSEIFNKDIEELQGGELASFSSAFSNFVGHLNKKITDRGDAYDYRVIALPPEQDPKTKKWISKIVSIDPSGEEDTFDFTPDGIPRKGEKIIKQPKKAKEEKRQKSEQEKVKELDLKILQEETKQIKEKSRQQANEMFLKGLYSKKEYKDEIERINKL